MRKANFNKKGFTLIELLAVIVILAIIMVFAIPAVLDTSNSAQKKSFQVYGGRISSLVQEKLAGDRLLGTLDSSGVLTAEDIGLKDTGGFSVCVTYQNSGGANSQDSSSLEYDINIFMTNGRFCTGSGSTPGSTSYTTITKAEPVTTSCPLKYNKGSNTCTAASS